MSEIRCPICGLPDLVQGPDRFEIRCTKCKSLFLFDDITPLMGEELRLKAELVKVENAIDMLAGFIEEGNQRQGGVN